MKYEFIKSISQAESLDDIWDAIRACGYPYARGYMDAKFEDYTDSNDDLDGAKEFILDIARYDIWK